MKLHGLILPPTLLLGLALTGATYADTGTQADADRDADTTYTQMLEEAERTRHEAESAREEARRAAETARATARKEAEFARQEAEMARAEQQMERQEMAQEHAARREELEREREARQREMALAREELSRAHRELREASREIAQAHRELAHSDIVRQTVRVVNLGDRAVIGIIMGPEVDQGVKIIGVSPDGPAERAGLQQGDVLLTIAGETATRKTISETMAVAEAGEELTVTVDREGENWEFTVTPEIREPSSWQTLINIQETEHVQPVHGEKHIVIEHIEIPQIDTAEIEAQMAEVSENLKTMRYNYDFNEENFTVRVEDYSDLAGSAFRSADVWFGMPHTQGLELASINEGLGDYFKTERGVLVIKAREDNAYELRSGDVILQVDSTEVNSPADVMRILREIDPGQEIELEIMRQRRDETLNVVMPENRLGYRLNSHRH